MTCAQPAFSKKRETPHTENSEYFITLQRNKSAHPPEFILDSQRFQTCFTVNLFWLTDSDILVTKPNIYYLNSNQKQGEYMPQKD